MICPSGSHGGSWLPITVCAWRHMAVSFAGSDSVNPLLIALFTVLFT
jgi:hypothetical protein